jgi:ABC-type multidrug transport system permease subunit
MLLGWVVVSSMGFIVSAAIINASPYSMNAIINILAFGMAYLTPVYYPASGLGSFSWLSVLTPISAAANIVRTLGGLAPMDGLTLLSLAILIVEGLLFTLVFVARSRWRED